MQKRLKKGNLIDSSGHLLESGFAKEHVKYYNRKQIKRSKFRIKEWDYHYINNDQFGLGITIADNGYIGIVSLALIDFSNQEVTQKMITQWLPRGKMNLVCHPENGKTTFIKRGVNFSVSYNKLRTTIKLYWKKFKDDLPLELDIKLNNKPQDSIVLSVPFQKPHQFYYNQKIIGMSAKGYVKYQDKTYNFVPSNSSALLDYGRGVWPYKSEWYWGAAQGFYNQTKIGLNIGGGFGNTTYGSEDIFFIDGIGHKLDRGHFTLSKQEDGQNDLMQPWYYKTEDKRLDVTFTPNIKRYSKTNLGIVKNVQTQIFGHYSGYVILDDGSKLTFDDLPGFAEYFINKW